MLSLKNHIELQEETQELAEICLNLIDDFIEENYEFTNESFEISEESEIILDIILDHFIENYDVTLLESEDFTRNDELIAEIYDVIMNESIGSGIASLIHGTGGERKAYAKAKLKPELMRIKQKEDPKYFTKKIISATSTTPQITKYTPTYKEKAKEHQQKIGSGAYGSGIFGAIKKKIGERDVVKSQKKFENLESKIRVQKSKIGIAGQRLRQKEAKTARLAYKIDRAIKPTNVARAAIKGTLKGIAWAGKKLIGKPKRTYRYRRYH